MSEGVKTWLLAKKWIVAGVAVLVSVEAWWVFPSGEAVYQCESEQDRAVLVRALIRSRCIPGGWLDERTRPARGLSYLCRPT
jgi:hypothetical protein